MSLTLRRLLPGAALRAAGTSAGASQFIPMALSDVIDEDMVRQGRKRRASTMFFGLNALVSQGDAYPRLGLSAPRTHAEPACVGCRSSCLPVDQACAVSGPHGRCVDLVSEWVPRRRHGDRGCGRGRAHTVRHDAGARHSGVPYYVWRASRVWPGAAASMVGARSQRREVRERGGE